MSLPVTVVNASDRDPSTRAADVIGWILWLVGLVVEATADQQKLKFKNSPESRGKWCNVGVWSFSRHPNYFGEVRWHSYIHIHKFLWTIFHKKVLSFGFLIELLFTDSPLVGSFHCFNPCTEGS